MAKEVLTPLAVHQLHAVLQRFDGSLLGAPQLLRGEIITKPADRRAIASMIRALLQSRTQELVRIAMIYRQITWRATGKGAWSDDWH